MNLITQSVVRVALAQLERGTAAPRLPAQFAATVIAKALAEHGKLSPLHAHLTGDALAAEAHRLESWTAEPGRGYVWLSPGGCGVVVELDGVQMTTVESDGRAIGRWHRGISAATLGFLDPGVLVAHG